MELIFGIAAVVLLIIVIVLQLVKKDDAHGDKLEALFRKHGDAQRDEIARQLASGATEQFNRFGMIQNSVQATLQGSREETLKQLNELQTIIQATLQGSREETNKQLREFQDQLDARLLSIQRGSAENIEKVNATLEAKMRALQESNEKRLEQMQGVVDEKLQKTLEIRLTQSFELVNKQLEGVQQGLGEMKNLAADAKSLRNALTNVKERGTYGEVRLEKLLSDILAPSQYETNVEIAAGKRVEFAVKLPGTGDAPVLLPIDSKFPIEDYNRLLDAEDKASIDDARKSLAQKIRVFAKDIYEKYIVPPKTTDFALMFLPTEGLYAEVVQNAVLFEELREKFKIIVTGPTTLSALLGSLQIGFKTLAFEKNSQKVWDTLRAFKSEFIKFGETFQRVQKQIQTADKTLDELVGTRAKAIGRTLRGVEGLETSAAPNQIELNQIEVNQIEGEDF